MKCVQSLILKVPRHIDQLLNYNEFSFQWVFSKRRVEGQRESVFLFVNYETGLFVVFVYIFHWIFM